MLIYSIIYIILSSAVSLKRDVSILFGRIAIAVLILSFITNNLSFVMIEEGIGLYGGLLHITSTTQVFHTFIFLVSAIILILNSFYVERRTTVNKNKIYSQMLRKIEHNVIEYPLIILFVVTGALFLVSSSDLVSIFLAIELQSYGLYLLSSVHRNTLFGLSGGLMYFLLGSLSSCFILLGTGLLYTNSGTTYLDGIYIITSISDIMQNDITSWYKPYYINYSLIFFTVGFLFKIGAAPFHYWSPDVYDNIPTVVTTFVSIIAKISILIFLLELVYYTSGFFISQFNWTQVLVLSSLLSLVVGSVAGLTETNIKKLFAYSTITHVGFMLLALAINTIESTQAFLFYLMQYSLSNINAFFLLMAIGYYYYKWDASKKKLSESSYSTILYTIQLIGLIHKKPILSISLAITIFSWMGIPPLVGFFGKQMVLSAALDNGYIFLTLVGLVTSVISGVYYLNVVKYMSFYKENSIENFESSTFTLSSPINIIISILTLIILLFTMIPETWLSMTNILALLIFKT
jgi:NADH-ubiquinone oxidoreductase chain 2